VCTNGKSLSTVRHDLPIVAPRLTAHEYPDNVGTSATHLAVIDTTTGTQLGQTFNLSGQLSVGTVLTNNYRWVWLTTHLPGSLTIIDLGAGGIATTAL
jgi:hypothetical protein